MGASLDLTGNLVVLSASPPRSHHARVEGNNVESGRNSPHGWLKKFRARVRACARAGGRVGTT